MIKIYAFIGVSGSGKDYQKDLIKEKSSNVIELDFSDGVREFTFSFLGVKPPNKPAYEKFKERLNTIDSGDKLKIMSGRDFLDNVGKKMRNYDPDFWADYTFSMALKKYRGLPEIKDHVFCFGSCRYKNEVEVVIEFFKFVKDSEGECDIKFIFCDYKSPKYDDRPLEYQQLALLLREEGCQDGDDITIRIFNLFN